MASSTSAFFTSVDEYVAFCCGDHAIKKILIANNGIGATKAIRSIRRWAFETFGNERMVYTATPHTRRKQSVFGFVTSVKTQNTHSCVYVLICIIYVYIICI